MDKYDAMPVIVINDTILQIISWAGTTIPDALIPLDGRIVNGIKIPDRRNNFIFAADPSNNKIIYSITECVLLKDIENIITNGELNDP